MKSFFEKATMQYHPLRVLETFLEQEQANEQANNYDALRFVGYVLVIGYDTATIITSDSLKISVGGVPRNSLLIMVPSSFEKLPWHFTLLRVLESAPTPLTKEVQQTYFELQKKSMPELDVFTQSELQWGALKTEVLGMFYPHPEKPDTVEFSGDLNNFVSAHKYKVYAPDNALLDLIINSIVPRENRTVIGKLRLTECRLPLPDKPLPQVNVFLSTIDFRGTRTAMFGKTRLGKSNIVKLLAQSLIETTAQTKDVGQLIFDIDGEYANNNEQHGKRSLKSGYPTRCFVYAVTPKAETESKPLKLNFYEQPDSSLRILRSLLQGDKRESIYIQSFASVNLPSLEEVNALNNTSGDFTRALRKLQIFWAILREAGYSVDQQRLFQLAPYGTATSANKFNPSFKQDLRAAAYGLPSESLPEIGNLDALVKELKTVNRFRRSSNRSNNKLLQSSSGNPVFESDDIALLDFLDPTSGSGPSVIKKYSHYHASNAGNFVEDILKLLEKGETVILDLGNADPEIMEYFSKHLSNAVFQHQVEQFTNNKLGEHYIQVYFEEAHNLFPYDEDPKSIYNRFAKQGAKFHIGMVYSTQSPTTISRDLLAQTENFFIAHLSSQDEVNALAKVNTAYESLKEDILRAKTPGYVRMLTRSHRFVVSVQAKEFTPPQ